MKLVRVGSVLNARVRIGGRAYWLGRCPDGKVTAAQTAKAALIWHEHLSGVTGPPQRSEIPPPTTTAPEPTTSAAVMPTQGFTIADVGVKYLDHCQRYYRTADGRVTSSVAGVEMALRAMFPFSDLSAESFGPRAMKTMRDALVRDGRPRVTCNRVAKTVRRMFKWAASEELVSSAVWHSLETVAPLQKGRTDAHELPPIDEVPEPIVAATIPHLPRVVAAMVWFQRWTGARPGEVCLLRPCDIDRSGDVWIYTPHHHKLAWREDSQPRRIAIGAEGKRVLMPYLLRSASSYCFSPSEAERDRAELRRADRQSPLTPSQRARKPKRNGGRRPGDQYTTASYRRAITRAVDQANRAREADGVADRLPNWAPNQLRHLRAGEIEERLGIEAASAVLGHTDLRTTQIYAKRKIQIATEVARQIG